MHALSIMSDSLRFSFPFSSFRQYMYLQYLLLRNKFCENRIRADPWITSVLQEERGIRYMLEHDTAS